MGCLGEYHVGRRVGKARLEKCLYLLSNQGGKGDLVPKCLEEYLISNLKLLLGPSELGKKIIEHSEFPSKFPTTSHMALLQGKWGKSKSGGVLVLLFGDWDIFYGLLLVSH